MIVLPPEILTAPGFTRASTAMFTDAAGVVQAAAVNVLRPRYIGGELRGAIIEAASTNLITYNAQFENVVWNKSACTVTANAMVGIFGTATADLMLETVSTAEHFLYRDVALSAGTTYTFSIYARASGARSLILGVKTLAGLYPTGTFDLAAGVVLANAGAYPAAICGIEAVGGGIYRCSITFNSGAGAVTPQVFINTGTAAGARSTTGGAGLYLEGAQLELGTVATSVIPTAAAAVTRAADVLTSSGRDVLYSNAVESAAAWVSGTNYVLGAIVTRPNNRRYATLVPITGSTIAPELDTARWEDIGAINPLAMFDQGRNLQTVGPIGSKLRVAIYSSGRVNSLFLARLEASYGTVVMYVGGVEVYRKALTLTRRRTHSWSTYYFGTFEQLSSVMLTDLPMLAGATIVLELDNGIYAAKCASMVIAQRVELGDSEWGAASDPLVFSVVKRDDYGNARLVPRRMAPATSQTLQIPAAQTPVANALRDRLNARPAVWAGMNANTEGPWSELFLICGIYTRFKITALNAKTSRVELDLQEL